MKRIIVCFVCLLCAFAPVLAQEQLTPPLAEGQAQAVQRLSIMSQQDEALDGLPYNGGFLRGRGCQPTSIANGVIAAFGVEDRQTAVELVKETTQVLVVPWERGTGRMVLGRIANLFSAQERAEEAQEFPHLAALMDGYDGEITVLEDKLNAELVAEHFAGLQAGMLVGGMQVHPEWTDLLGVMHKLYEMGMQDAVVTLASVGVGTGDSGMPLATGKSGHYLSIMMYVGSFVEEGRIYVLDSLPRALAGEESGNDLVLRQPYPFATKKRGFAEQFDARRIRDTVIELRPAQQQAWREAAPEQKNRMLKALTLFGPGILTIAWQPESL